MAIHSVLVLCSLEGKELKLEASKNEFPFMEGKGLRIGKNPSRQKWSFFSHFFCLVVIKTKTSLSFEEEGSLMCCGGREASIIACRKELMWFDWTYDLFELGYSVERVTLPEEILAVEICRKGIAVVGLSDGR